MLHRQCHGTLSPWLAHPGSFLYTLLQLKVRRWQHAKLKVGKLYFVFLRGNQEETTILQGPPKQDTHMKYVPNCGQRGRPVLL